MGSRRNKQISLGVVLSYLSIAVKMLSGVLYTPVVFHSLGQNQYGVYSLCISVIGYLTILNAGVNAAYIRFYVQEKTNSDNNVGQLNALFLKIFVVLSVVGLFGGLLISFFSPVIFGTKISPAEYVLVKRCFNLLAVTTAVEIFTCLFKSFITANEEFIFGKSIDILVSVLAPVITIPFLLKGYDCTAIISVRLVVSSFALLLNILFCYQKLHIFFVHDNNIDMSLLRNITQFIGFIVLQSIMDQLNWQVDKFILARTQGTAEISVYSIGGIFNSYFLLIGAAVSGVFIAQINRFVAQGDEVKLNDLFRKTSKLFLYLISLIILSFVFFGKPFILRWAGATYEDAYTVGCLLMSPITLSLIMGLGQDIARAKNKHQLQILINICVCVVNMIISIPLAIKWGAIGSAFGTFLAEVVLCVIIQPFYYVRVLGLNVRDIFSDILHFLPGLIAPSCFGILMIYFNIVKNEYVSILIFLSVFVVIYAVSVYLFSLDKHERDTVKAFVKCRKKLNDGS